MSAQFEITTVRSGDAPLFSISRRRIVSPIAMLRAARRHEERVDRLERAVDRVAVEVLHQHRHFRKHVLKRHHERRAEPQAGQPRRQADDRRIGQRDDDVGLVEPEAGVARGQEVRDVVAGAAGESTLRESRAARPEDLDAVVTVAREHAGTATSCPATGCSGRPATTDTRQP